MSTNTFGILSMQTAKTRRAGQDSEKKNIGHRPRFCVTELTRLVRILLCETKVVRFWPFFVGFLALEPTMKHIGKQKTNTRCNRVF